MDRNSNVVSIEGFEEAEYFRGGYAIVKKDGLYGAVGKDLQLSIPIKYDKIEYIPTTGDFLVQSNKKYGIVSSEGSTKVSISYDSIELMDRDKNMYLVKRDGKYGVIDINENVED